MADNFRDLHISVTGSDGHQQAISPYHQVDYFGGQHARTYTKLVKTDAGGDIAQFTGSLAAPRAFMLDVNSKTTIGAGFTGTIRLWEGGVIPLSAFYSGSGAGITAANGRVVTYEPIPIAVREVSGSNCDFYAIY
tara:strand:+ start:77 stop:481 length:405 start_codon:yes stop_codon:yes gene_type:complete